MEMDKKRQKLPYMETALCFSINGRKMIAKKHQNHLEFPVVEMQEGEAPDQAINRALPDMIGTTFIKPRFLHTIDTDWQPEWAESDPKRKQLYAKYRGERVHMFVIFCRKSQSQSTKQGALWDGIKDHMYYVDDLFKFMDENIQKMPPQHYYQQIMQSCILKMIKMMMDATNKQRKVAVKNIEQGNKIQDIFSCRLYF